MATHIRTICTGVSNNPIRLVKHPAKKKDEEGRDCVIDPEEAVELSCGRRGQLSAPVDDYLCTVQVASLAYDCAYRRTGVLSSPPVDLALPRSLFLK